MNVHACSGELAKGKNCQCPGNFWGRVGVLPGQTQLGDLQQPVRDPPCLLTCVSSVLRTSVMTERGNDWGRVASAVHYSYD